MTLAANHFSSRIWFFALLLFVSSLAQAQDVEVNSADPSSAQQGTVDLDVEIAGSGFDNSAAVEFFVTGTTNPGGITVKNVKVRGNKKIIATIDVDDAAIVDEFDIEVSLSRGRKGKGTTLFSVQQKPTGKPGDEYTSPNEGVQFITPSDIAGFDYHIIGTSSRDDIIAGDGQDLIEGLGDNDDIDGRDNNDVIYGGDGHDRLEGGAGNDTLYGENGSDSLSGGPGTDILIGAAGNDEFIFSLGAFNGVTYEVDTYDAGSGTFDKIDFHDIPDIVGVVVDLVADTYEATIANTAVGTVTVSGVIPGLDAVWGSEGNDVLYGTDGDDYQDPVSQSGPLYGSGGNDLIYGFAGNDAVWGGTGDDTLYGGPGDDWLRGYYGSDVIFGGDGNDFFESFDDGTDDTYHGGPGCDYFEFSSEIGRDTIVDFDPTCEIIDLSRYNPKYRLAYRHLEISEVGSDLEIYFWFNKQGGAGGTIVLKDAAANGVVLNEGHFVF